MDELKKLAEALKGLGDAIEKQVPKVSTLQDQWGWNVPPISPTNLGDHARSLAAQIDGIDRSKISSDYTTDYLVTRIETLKSTTLPQVSGSPLPAFQVYFQFLDWLRHDFAQFFEADVNWRTVADANRLPRQFAARLRALDAALDSHKTRSDEFESQVKVIADAYETAMNLPTDAQEMRALKDEIIKLRRDAENERALTALAAEKARELVESISDRETAAVMLVANTEDAYRAATTRGLGEAFQTRADGLSKSMRWWVSALAGALVTGAVIGYFRVVTLQDLLAQNASAQVIWLNLSLSFLSLAAPIWFAWIATKQTGHRFRLAEDYAFKASVAKAYEGYRREAARLDDDFVKRLFGSILDRLDEAPIRFVEHDTPGTPWHEIFGRRKLADTEPKTSEAPIKPVSSHRRSSKGQSKVEGHADTSSEPG